MVGCYLGGGCYGELKRSHAEKDPEYLFRDGAVFAHENGLEQNVINYQCNHKQYNAEPKGDHEII
jgi:hypothetical protein